jgi:hypothetical protein
LAYIFVKRVQYARFNFPVCPGILALFIAYLFNQNYAPSTVNTCVSALGYSHRLYGVPDPTKICYIIQMLKGYGKLGHRLDVRLPITLHILHTLIGVTGVVLPTSYEVSLFRAMCVYAFFGFLRIGEITLSKPSLPMPLQINQLSKQFSTKGQITHLTQTFYQYKHSYNQQPFSIDILPQQVHCPVKLVLHYLSLRGTCPGTLFLDNTGRPITRDCFSNYLALTIKHCGLDLARYKGDSFRIGAGSYAAKHGMSDAQIRTLTDGNPMPFKNTYIFLIFPHKY